MKKSGIYCLLILIFIVISVVQGFSQVGRVSGDLPVRSNDSVSVNKNALIQKVPQSAIKLTPDQAIDFLRKRYYAKFWESQQYPLREAIGQLVYEAEHPVYDSVRAFLENYPFDSLEITRDKYLRWRSKQLNMPAVENPDTLIHTDSISSADTSKIRSFPDADTSVAPAVPERVVRIKHAEGLQDTVKLDISDTLRSKSPYKRGFHLRYPGLTFQPDSVKAAVRTLIDFLDTRDSMIVYITGRGSVVTPVWLNSPKAIMHRYWLRNELNDSVTIWAGALSRDTLGLYLESGVSFKRPGKEGNYSEARINMQKVDRSTLQKVTNIRIKPQYWRYRAEANFALNQTSLSNWVKGGESSVALSTDVTGYADYNNEKMKISSKNFVRLNFGEIAVHQGPSWNIRKNLDLLETNSKLNHKAFGKFDFSAILLFKTQIAKGYNYPNDSVPVSKFMNPATLTVGLGLDYKPSRTISINFSPFSYKGTYVPDTATVNIYQTGGIDQTQYGIERKKRALNEPGASFMITNEFRPIKKVTVTNRLQLFTNYIHNPQNVDVDWEMILTANLNWFTDVRFNTHLIFDDDTKTPEFDKNNKPILVDGVQKKTARVQFKELLGFSFVFRF